MGADRYLQGHTDLADEFGNCGCDDRCDDICDDCIDDEALAHPSLSHLASHVIQSHETVIPAITLSTVSDTVTEGCHTYGSHLDSTACIDNDYHVSGSLKTHKYDCVQECQLDADCFDACGGSHSTITRDGHVSNSNASGLGECACQGVDEDAVVDPEVDISTRVGRSVEKTVGDVLSEVLNRCISSSLQSCIKMN